MRAVQWRTKPTRTNTMSNAITWFEIPALDLERAATFYETILGGKLAREKMGPFRMAVFPHAQAGVGGCVIAADGYQPSATGSVVYLNAGPSLEAVLARVAKAGGEIALPKTALPDGMGCYAHVIDSEGNRVGLHAAA
jgi:hypothetical protein